MKLVSISAFFASVFPFMFAGSAFAQDTSQADASAASIDRSAPTFSSVSDGQPGSPGQMTVAGLVSYSQGDWEFQTALQYTPKGDFFEDALFTLTLPTVDAGEGIADAETSATLSWQQLWIGTASDPVNFSTSIAVQVPVDEPGQSTDVIATAGLNILMGKGVGYLNGFVETQNGPGNPAPAEWGAVAGYKLPLTSKIAVLGDALYSTGDNLELEASLYINANDHLSIGPGVFVQTTLDDGSSDVAFGAGVVLALSL